MFAIVLQNSAEGPTRKSKIVFFFAAIFHLVNDLPTFIWIQILPGAYIRVSACLCKLCKILFARESDTYMFSFKMAALSVLRVIWTWLVYLISFLSYCSSFSFAGNFYVIWKK